MTESETADLDKVFKALGSETRRRILRLLSQQPSYPYELSKVLGLTPRGVVKHLEALQEAGLIQREAGESDLGPDRVYYRLNTRVGLSTTILPDTFVVRLTRREATGRMFIPRGFVVPDARPDEAAVRELLRELGKVNRKLFQLDEERMRFISLRSKIIRKIEEIMEYCAWDDESCKKARGLLDPVRSSTTDSRPFSEIWSETMRQTLKMFEELFTEIQSDELDEYRSAQED